MENHKRFNYFWENIRFYSPIAGGVIAYFTLFSFTIFAYYKHCKIEGIIENIWSFFVIKFHVIFALAGFEACVVGYVALLVWALLNGDYIENCDRGL